MDVRASSPYQSSYEELDENGNLAGLIASDSEEEHPPQKTYHLRKRTKDTLERNAPSKKSKTEDEVPEPLPPKPSPMIMTELCPIPEESVGTIVVGRDQEAHMILRMVGAAQGGTRPLLLGPSGIGKLMIVEKTAYLYKTQFGALFPKRKVYCLNSPQLLADYNKPANPEAVINKLSFLMQFIYMSEELGSEPPPILYIKDIDKLFSIETIRDYVATSFLRSSSPFIASISEQSDETKKIIKFLENYNFQPIQVKESPLEDVIDIVINYLTHNPINDQVPACFTKDAINLAVTLAGKYVKTQPFPRKAINLIQECAVRFLMQSEMDEKGVVIDSKKIAVHVSDMTGIRVEDLLNETVFDKQRFMERLKKELVGQEHAIRCVSTCVAKYKQGLSDPNKPVGVFLFIGPTGVGKTSLAKLLAKQLYHNQNALIRINGQNYSEPHSIADLIGSPKGYEGHETGGLLTEALRKNPYQVVLFDELEKADEKVWNLFLQVFDEGILDDKLGTPVDCSNTLFIMTSNVGQNEIFLNPENAHLGPNEVEDHIRPLLEEKFHVEYCNRFDIVPFQPLKQQHYPNVIRVQLNRIQERLKKQTSIDLQFTDNLVAFFLKSDFDPRYGMRKLCATVDKKVTSTLERVASKLKRPLKGEIRLDATETKIQIVIKKGVVG